MANAIDRLIGLEWLKKKVDKAHGEAKADAEDELARKRDEGVMELASPMFGAEAGTYKYSKTRKKTVVEYNLADAGEFAEWREGNPDAAQEFVRTHVREFAVWWFANTGEVPDGIARVEYEKPAGIGAPKLYGFDGYTVESKLKGNLMESVNELLLGDAR